MASDGLEMDELLEKAAAYDALKAEVERLRAEAARGNWLVAQFISYGVTGPDGTVYGYRLRGEFRFRRGSLKEGEPIELPPFVEMVDEIRAGEKQDGEA